jgi:hypothetical protein
MTIRYIKILEIEKRNPTPILSVFIFIFWRGGQMFFFISTKKNCEWFAFLV